MLLSLLPVQTNCPPFLTAWSEYENKGHFQTSSTMLRSRALTTALNKLSTGGIRSAMLFNPEGVLLAFSSLADESERSKAAIAANIWNIYQHHLETSEADTVQEIMFEFAEGRLILCRVALLLLCLHGSKDVPLGMLRAKAMTLIENLEKPLLDLADS
ncbi:hypothetical protein CRM22_007333 [Opisthorchis felineus]|uniref:Roadblock/LAMTOR2 domain-containing protein n=1 Tax=Opisthorchis felineus TaxID=147828 RepID=A0A4S2LP45_OPIFE|nr:hypothetical protein CRM22_007333 [Opisthorchis felineus]